MASSLGEGSALPTLAQLGEQFDIHASTVLRIMRGLVDEGVYWQSPSGRFYSAGLRRDKLRGAPICFVGRELWRWSRLYQEMLEGVSEIAGANGSPLVALTSRSLVRQSTTEDVPHFASRRTQSKELADLLTAAPKGSAGFILDHLWLPEVIESARWPGGQRVQLLCGAGKAKIVARVDAARGAGMAAEYARKLGASRILLVNPFSGDPAIDSSTKLLKRALSEFDLVVRDFRAVTENRNPGRCSLVVCPEDYGVLALVALFGEGSPPVIGTQGTGVLQPPHALFRYDYKSLGRAAASAVLTGKSCDPFGPVPMTR